MGSLVIRHSKSAYPLDALTGEGVRIAQSSRERFSDRRMAVCSTAFRTQQTAQALGFGEVVVDSRLDEFVADDINMSTSHKYVLEVHKKYWNALEDYGRQLLEAMREFGVEEALLVSHNAVMSAAFRIAMGNVRSFGNLDGFEL
ncbi:MAG: histidine phosphatase family protein [Patescibacteria group bacterium]